MDQKTIIIIGATTGIGYALVQQYLAAGWRVGATGRRIELLDALQQAHPDTLTLQKHDATAPDQIGVVESLADALGGASLVVYNAGVGQTNKQMDWAPEAQTVQVNVAAFAETAAWAYRYFSGRGRGHFVGISSVAALIPNPTAPAYSASKAFMSLYLEGLQWRAARRKPGIYFTEIRPGFIDTPMTEGRQGMFWVISAAQAARRIKKAVDRRRRVAYVPRRWRLIAGLLLLWRLARNR